MVNVELEELVMVVALDERTSLESVPVSDTELSIKSLEFSVEGFEEYLISIAFDVILIFPKVEVKRASSWRRRKTFDDPKYANSSRLRRVYLPAISILSPKEKNAPPS